MSLIIPRNFKRAKAQDAVARNAASDELNVGDKIWITQYGRNYPYTITKKWKEGWTVWYKAKNDKSGKEETVAGAFANALDAAAQDAKFKVGDRVKHAKVKSPVQPIGKISEVYNDQRWVEVEWENMPYKYQTIETSNLLPANSRAADAKDSIADKEREYTRLYELAQKNITFHAAKGDSAKVAEWKRKADEYKRLAQEAENAAGDAAEFHVGQRVRAKDPRWTGYQGHALGNGVYTVKKVDRDGTVKLDGFLDVWISPSSLVEANDACEDSAAKFRLGQEVIVKTKYADPYRARIVGLWDMSQNGPYGEQGYLVKNIKGGGVESMPEHALSLATAKDSSELNNDADLRAALSKMADIAKRLTGANVSFKAGWTPEGVGEISLEFPDSESARRYNYYKLFNAWEAARSQIVPRWAVNIGGYRVPRIEGNRMTISVLHFST